MLVGAMVDDSPYYIRLSDISDIYDFFLAGCRGSSAYLSDLTGPGCGCIMFIVRLSLNQGKRIKLRRNDT